MPALSRSLSTLMLLLFASCSVLAGTELEVRMAQPRNWAAQGGNFYNWRHSELTQIKPRNVSRLQVAWRYETGVARGHEGSPLVVGDMLYLHTPYPNKVVALSLADHSVKWTYEPKQSAEVVPIMCCDSVSRGLAYGNGKIFLQQADTKLVALDARTGSELWKVQNGDTAKGATATNAPQVFDRYVITGIAGGEYGVLGYITAYDIGSGRLVWRGYSAGSDRSMLMDPDHSLTWRNGRMEPVGSDSSLASWKGDQWKTGGGTTWGWYSYDPALRLLYYGSGNPGTWNPLQRPGDNKWSMSLWARDIDSGTVRWVYQMTPNDEWDYDGVNELVLFDAADATGRTRELLAHFDRNGFAYTLDRRSGELLVAEKFDPSVNWASHVDIRTGRPQVAKEFSPAQTGEDETTKNICPPAIGTKNQAPAAYDPSLGLFFVPTSHLCMDFETFHADYTAGQPYIGASLTMHAVPGDEASLGRFIAWDAIHGRTVWSVPESLPLWGGVLSTRSGLVFYGTLDGHLKAVDAKTGKLLWESPKLKSGIVGNVMTWAYKGRQFVGVFTGIGGLANDPDGIARLHDKLTGHGAAVSGELVVFALP